MSFFTRNGERGGIKIRIKYSEATHFFISKRSFSRFAKKNEEKMRRGTNGGRKLKNKGAKNTR